MKKLIMGFLVLMATAQAHADKQYVCLDRKTGKDAGKIEAAGTQDANGNGKVHYYSSSTSSEYWILTLTEEGKLYNADPMVQHGKDFYVGEIGYENFKLLVTISGRNLYCD